MKNLNLLLLCCLAVVGLSQNSAAQAYDQCGYTSSVADSIPLPPVNTTDYPQTTAVICADATFPECSTPADAADGANFAGDCGSPNFDFIITNPQNTVTGDLGPAILGVTGTGVLDVTTIDVDAATAGVQTLAIGESVCMTGFCYDLPQIQLFVTQLNGSASGCSAAESLAGTPVCPVAVPNDLADLFAIAASIGAGGDLSIGDVVAILPQLDALGAIDPSITALPICGLVSGADSNVADYCMEVVDCSADGAPCVADAVPTMGAWALIIMSLLMLTLSTIAIASKEETFVRA